MKEQTNTTRQHTRQQSKETTMQNLTIEFESYINFLLNCLIKANWDCKEMRLKEIEKLIEKMKDVLGYINYPY